MRLEVNFSTKARKSSLIQKEALASDNNIHVLCELGCKHILSDSCVPKEENLYFFVVLAGFTEFCQFETDIFCQQYLEILQNDLVVVCR